MSETLPVSDGRVACEAFLQAWKDREWSKAAGTTTLTFQHADQNPAKSLQKMLEPQRLISFRVRNVFEGVHDLTGVNQMTAGVKLYYCDVEVKLLISVAGRQQKRRALIRVVCETAPRVSDLSGVWGVNPFSITRSAKVAVDVPAVNGSR
jgi:hypothetical protein